MLYQVNGTDIVGKMSITPVTKEIEKANSDDSFIRLETPLTEFLECYEHNGTEIVLKADWEAIKATKEAELQDATYNQETQVAVPNTITLRQVREQTIRMGMFTNIEAYIDSIEDETEKAIARNYWEYSEVFDRQHPLLLSLAGGLGMTKEQLDSMFIEAAKL